MAAAAADDDSAATGKGAAGFGVAAGVDGAAASVRRRMEAAVGQRPHRIASSSSSFPPVSSPPLPSSLICSARRRWGAQPHTTATKGVPHGASPALALLPPSHRRGAAARSPMPLEGHDAAAVAGHLDRHGAGVRHGARPALAPLPSPHRQRVPVIEEVSKDFDNRSKLTELVRYPSTKSDNESISIKDYGTPLVSGLAMLSIYDTPSVSTSALPASPQDSKDEDGKYSDEELQNILLDWISDPEKDSPIQKLDIFESDVNELPLGVRFYLVQLKGSKGKFNRHICKNDVKFSWRMSHREQDDSIEKTTYLFRVNKNLVRDVRLIEYRVKDGPQDKVLCKLVNRQRSTNIPNVRLGCQMRNNSRLKEDDIEERGNLESCEVDVSGSTQIEAITQLQEEIKYLRSRLEQKDEDINILKFKLEEAEAKALEEKKLRKMLEEKMLDMKGKIRVFCRVRPTQPNETRVVSCLEAEGVIRLTLREEECSFQYDKVFNEAATQMNLFEEMRPVILTAVEGHKVCIFAYGQTGSGKTYTMMGRPGFDQKGIIPRSLEQIFKSSQSLESQGWKYSMQVSMLEIYNETIRDLLAPGRPNSFEMTSSKQYTIKHDTLGNTTVSDLTVIDVFGTADVTSLLEKASQSRSVGRTQMNEQSSRSHFVFTLKISGSNEHTGQQVQGVLNLIDLAGSERLAKSGSTGDRLKETQAINKSLSALSDVIFAIAKGDDHVPFRNSKLTYLLQPCLGGDSKTLMFVNVSPEASSVGETICSLRFASRVNACEIGISRRHIHA